VLVQAFGEEFLTLFWQIARMDWQLSVIGFEWKLSNFGRLSLIKNRMSQSIFKPLKNFFPR